MSSIAAIGFIILNLQFLLTALILYKAFKFRVSGASIIAALTMTWITSIVFIMVLVSLGILQDLSPGLTGGLMMFFSVLIYSGWLYFFQPKSAKAILEKELEKNKKKLADMKD